MSGHSKFANIKHKKEKNDASRGKVFTKLGRELVVAIKEGGADPNGNSKLRDVISKCKAANMPNDTIERAIKKAAGQQDVDYESITYEGYGPAGIAIMVDCLTDNHNRTASDVRYAFSRNGGNLGTTGCVSFMFDKKGQITAEMPEEGADEEEIMMTALDAGAEDVEIEDGEILVRGPNVSPGYWQRPDETERDPYQTDSREALSGIDLRAFRLQAEQQHDDGSEILLPRSHLFCFHSVHFSHSFGDMGVRFSPNIGKGFFRTPFPVRFLFPIKMLTAILTW